MTRLIPQLEPSMQVRDIEVPTADGWRLAMRRLSGSEGPAASALLLHAMMADRRSMDRPEGGGMASHLAARGLTVFLADFRGHGDSGPTVAEGGAWGYDDLVRLDLPALTAAARANGAGDGPLVIVGHSLGGHVSVAAAATGAVARPADAHVLLSANIWSREIDTHWPRQLRRAASIRTFQTVGRALGHFPARRLKMGSADEAGDYVEDLCRMWRTGRWAARDGTDYAAAARSLGGPVLSVVGAADALMAHPVGARRWAAALGPQGAEVWVVGRSTGLDFDPGHMEVVTDVRARPMWDDLASWIHRAAASPSRR